MRIKAIVTLYYPTQKTINNIKALVQQVDFLYLSDNTPFVFDNEDIKNQEKISYIWNKQNLGLSSAFNSILKKYHFTADDYILFFDQDSFVKENHIKTLIQEYILLQKKGINVGCLGPVIFDKHLNAPFKIKSIKKINKFSFQVDHIITSSMLTTFSNLQEINFWDENIFLDMADWDICWRFNKLGKVCCISECTVLEHSIGERRIKIGNFTILDENSVRFYYRIRDGLKLVLKSSTTCSNKLRILKVVSQCSLFDYLFLKKKSDRLIYIFKGFRDFVRRKNGPYK